MNTLPPPPSGEHGVNAVWLVFAIIPVILLLGGMVLGFRALHDIRVADGSLGGAMMATFAAGLLPALFIIAACGATVMLLGRGLTSDRLSAGILLSLGASAGLWLSFLMMRGMHREATGWTPSPPTPGAISSRTGLATAAIVLTILGGALTLFMLLLPNSPYVYGWRSQVNHFVMLDLTVLLAGFICGVLARRESAGKTCARVSGSLFLVLLLIVAG